jgi:hypothetical protein
MPQFKVSGKTPGPYRALKNDIPYVDALFVRFKKNCADLKDFRIL